MYLTTSKRLTNEGAKKMMAAAVAEANKAGIAVTIAIADAGPGMPADVTFLTAK